MSNVAVILSGGVGSRMGLNTPKQYLEVNGHPIIYYCLQTFCSNPDIDILLIVAEDSWRSYICSVLEGLKSEKRLYFANPGETRQFSIYNALRVGKSLGLSESDTVIIHDAARPLVTNQLISQCIEACKTAEAVLPVLPMKDTVYVSSDGMEISHLIPRETLWRGQAPEAFNFGKYLMAHDNARREDLLKINGSTELAFAAKMSCKLIKGDTQNIKITTLEDIDLFRNLINKE